MKSLALALAIALVGCGSEPDAAPAPPPQDTPMRIIESSGSTACTDGATRGCRIYLPASNGVVDCFESTQWCVGGKWHDCGKKPDDKTDKNDKADKKSDDAGTSD